MLTVLLVVSCVVAYTLGAMVVFIFAPDYMVYKQSNIDDWVARDYNGYKHDRPYGRPCDHPGAHLLAIFWPIALWPTLIICGTGVLRDRRVTKKYEQLRLAREAEKSGKQTPQASGGVPYSSKVKKSRVKHKTLTKILCELLDDDFLGWEWTGSTLKHQGAGIVLVLKSKRANFGISSQVSGKINQKRVWKAAQKAIARKTEWRITQALSDDEGGGPCQSHA
jgi:hypothetical protein